MQNQQNVSKGHVTEVVVSQAPGARSALCSLCANLNGISLTHLLSLAWLSDRETITIANRPRGWSQLGRPLFCLNLTMES